MPEDRRRKARRMLDMAGKARVSKDTYRELDRGREDIFDTHLADMRAPELRKAVNEKIDDKIIPVKTVLERLRAENKVLVAVLYGSYSRGTFHARSDIDIGIYMKAENELEEMDIVDSIRMAVEDDTDVSILYLHDTDESPFIIQEALAGIHLVEPDMDALYDTYGWALHESESMRFRGEMEERIEEVEAMMNIMRRKLLSYRVNYSAGNYTECIPSLFFILEALCRYALAGKGFYAHSHREVRELVARHLVSTGEVDKALYDHLSELYRRRQDADFTTTRFNKNEVDQYAELVRHGIELLKDHVDDGDRKELLALLSVSDDTGAAP